VVKNNNISDDKIVFKLKNENNIDIVGGGPAGLSVGYFAKKEGLEVKIYEASGTVGGNCKTIIDGEFRYDSGAHRLHDKSEYVTNEIKLLLGDKLKRVTSPSKIYYKGTFFNFPISVSDLIYKLDLSLLIKIIYDNILLRLRKRPSPKSFKQVAYQSYGKTISKMFLISYTEKLWGDDADNLDPTISGGRLKVLNLRSLMKDLFAIKKTDSDHLEGAFYYPELGFGEIFNALGAKIGPANIFLNKKVCMFIMIIIRFYPSRITVAKIIS
jgi:protoporphyrinogen oxidase